ncbi:MAG: helix-turn-helix domain-containing protein [[Clostridium] leptum]
MRKSMGLTQYQFGKLYGVSAGAVKRWESGKVRVTKGTWERIKSI